MEEEVQNLDERVVEDKVTLLAMRTSKSIGNVFAVDYKVSL
jgi:hypothetical protein